MMRSKRKLKITIVLLLATINICSPSFATNNELNEYYSRYVLSENLNEGIKVSLIKSDRYDNFQDEYVAVEVKVENTNRYANAEVQVEAIDHDDFTTLGDKTISFNLLSGDISEMIFDYRNNRTQKPYTPIGSQSEYIKSTQSVVYRRATISESVTRYVEYIRATQSVPYQRGDTQSSYIRATESSAYERENIQSKYLIATASSVYQRESEQSAYVRATFSSIYQNEKVSPYVKTTESEAIKYNVKKREARFDKDINLYWGDERATSSDVSERYTRDRKVLEEEETALKEKEDANKRKFVYILAVVFIVVLIALVAIYFIRRYIKSNEELYNILLIIGLSFILTICSFTFRVKKIYAYTQQTFMMNTTYSHEYLCEVWNSGIPWTFKFRVSYKFVGDMPSYPENQDSDGDGLVDNYEIYFITDRFSADTDGDGISDYDEIYTIDTDPLKLDTNNNGKTDGEEDYDGDGLTNIEEKNLNTFMDNSDTDSDGLTDYEEVRVYHTNPLKVDTDNDGLSDYEEVQVARKLGVSDISSISKTNTMNQELPRDNFGSSLYKENIIQMKVSGDVYGLIENHIKVKERRNATLDNVNSILGKVAYIDNDYETSNISVTFDISNYSLKKEALRVCTYENGKVKMLDTTLTENNISANINSGYVFVLDIDRYVDSILAYKKDNYK